ncbi:unnamed protein product [Prorocentrum cordatum]|uniref:Nudix hydrolase domain-containing protein n=1 Tax=Prorocentrum cordatum TaxID=2364126 RepID=A0ABN9P9Y0_9DINO|nr:unnamed protein product [Polarella glacialis]
MTRAAPRTSSATRPTAPSSCQTCSPAAGTGPRRRPTRWRAPLESTPPATSASWTRLRARELLAARSRRSRPARWRAPPEATPPATPAVWTRLRTHASAPPPAPRSRPRNRKARLCMSRGPRGTPWPTTRLEEPADAELQAEPVSRRPSRPSIVSGEDCIGTLVGAALLKGRASRRSGQHSQPSQADQLARNSWSRPVAGLWDRPEGYLHTQARSRPPQYPERASVDDARVPWSVAWEAYSPTPFSEGGLATAAGADPADPRGVAAELARRKTFEGAIVLEPDTGCPINPLGRTGMRGRGALQRWGPNHTADPIVTRTEPLTGRLQVMVARAGAGLFRLPGGEVDPGELVPAAVMREFAREADALAGGGHAEGLAGLQERLFSSGQVVYQGYADDARNTDNAWVETVAFHFHCDQHLGDALSLEGRAPEDAEALRRRARGVFLGARRDGTLQGALDKIHKDASKKSSLASRSRLSSRVRKAVGMKAMPALTEDGGSPAAPGPRVSSRVREVVWLNVDPQEEGYQKLHAGHRDWVDAAAAELARQGRLQSPPPDRAARSAATAPSSSGAGRGPLETRAGQGADRLSEAPRDRAASAAQPGAKAGAAEGGTSGKRAKRVVRMVTGSLRPEGAMENDACSSPRSSRRTRPPAGSASKSDSRGPAAPSSSE